MRVTIQTDGTYSYELSDKAQERLLRSAEIAYEKNQYVDCWFETYDDSFEEAHPGACPRAQYGDPIIVIETEGPMVPADRVVQPQEAKSIDSSQLEDDDAELVDEKDNGGDMMTVLPDRDNPDKANYSVEQLVKDSIETRSEQIENGRLPRRPHEEPEVPQFIQLMPELDGTVWSTAEAMFPVGGFYYRNVQTRIDYPPTPPSKTLEQARQESHETWQEMLENMDCKKTKKERHKSAQEERKPWDYDSTDTDETVNDGEVGARWNL